MEFFIKSMLPLLLLILGVFTSIAGIIIAHFFSNRRLWIAAVCMLFTGLSMGIYMNGVPLALISGFIIGAIWNLVIIPGALWTKYLKRVGEERLREREREIERIWKD